LSNYLILNSFIKGKVDTTLFTKHIDNDILIVQIYIDDIIFEFTNKMLCKDFESYIKKEFEISMIGELNYFLGLKIKQRGDEIFSNQAKYIRELIKKFGLENLKISKTTMATTIKLHKDEQGKNVNIKFYRCMIGSLLYLMASRPHVIFSVCRCAGFHSYL